MKEREIILDSHERKLIEIMSEYKNMQLDVGDIWFTSKKDDSDELNVEIIIERKTYSDLYSSIIDGRYSEQKERLKSYANAKEREIHPKLIYLIEGSSDEGIPNELCQSAILSMSIDCFSIIYSKNIMHTRDIILKIKSKLEKKLVSSGAISYETLIKPCKKENMTPKICYIQQLSCIPGLSLSMAKAIHEKYPNMRELLQEIDINGKLNIQEIKNNNRRLGKVLAQKIVMFFSTAE